MSSRYFLDEPASTGHTATGTAAGGGSGGWVTTGLTASTVVDTPDDWRAGVSDRATAIGFWLGAGRAGAAGSGGLGEVVLADGADCGEERSSCDRVAGNGAESPTLNRGVDATGAGATAGTALTRCARRSGVAPASTPGALATIIWLALNVVS